MLLEDRWSSRPRLGKEGGRKMTELMVVLIEDRLSSRPRLGEEGGRERTEFMVVLLEDRWSWCCWRTGGAPGPGWCWRPAGRGQNSW